MPRVLLIGSDRFFAEACVARGLEVVAVRNAGAVRNGVLTFPEEVRQVPVSDQTDTQSVVSGLAHAGLSLGDFDGIYTNYELAVVMTAGLAQAAGVPGPGTNVAVLMRDKYLQKQRLAEAGVPVARSQVFWAPPTPGDVEALGYPLVLKPVAGVGTEATVRVADAEAFDRAVASFFPAGTAHKGLQIEQFVTGEEFCLDGWVHDGTIGFSSVGRYAQTCLEAVEAEAALRIYRCTEATHPGLTAEADRLAAEALAALGLRSGVFHLEFFRLPDGQLVFSECAARRGGPFNEEEVRVSRSVSLAEASVDLCLGSEPKAAPSEPACEVGSVHPKLPPGVVLDLPRAEELAALDGVEYVRYYTYLGATYAGPSSSLYQPAAAMLVSAPTAAELDRRLDRVEIAFVTGSVVSPSRSPRAMRDFQSEVLGRDDLRYRPFTGGPDHGGHGRTT
ncbi:ATP-grasp domain-containing protein [Streptomyces sp. NBC_01210]|uniref:ATP-grasp domain-containing protein n=1 Tax=Streptomyces sp. NBC_01210 TaxID=2903774 RepID=UPI002E161C29|nr:ATP-grasp domain-containing protein [Streptomyces sp. NBC_01210]